MVYAGSGARQTTAISTFHLTSYMGQSLAPLAWNFDNKINRMKMVAQNMRAMDFQSNVYNFQPDQFTQGQANVGCRALTGTWRNERGSALLLRVTRQGVLSGTFQSSVALDHATTDAAGKYSFFLKRHPTVYSVLYPQYSSVFVCAFDLILVC